MADLSILVSTEAFRPRDFLYGASKTTGAGTPLSTGQLDLSLELADLAPALTLTPEQTNPPDEPIKLADGPPLVVLGIDLLIAVQAEPVRLRDTVYGAAAGVALSSGLQDATIRTADTVTAVLTPEQTGPNEALKLADVPTAILDQLVNLTEAIEIGDWVFGAARVTGTDKSAGLMEFPRVSESVSASLQLAISATESLKVGASGQIDLYGLGNRMRLADAAPTAGLDPRDVQVSPESARVLDTVTAQLSVIQLVVTAEALTLNDDPDLQGWVELSHDETVRIADTVTASIPGVGLSVNVTAESLKVDDTALTTTMPFQELVHVGASGRIDLIGLGNPLKLSDTVTASLSGAVNLSAAVSDEPLKVADSVLGPTLTPEQAVPAGEALSVADTVTVLLNPLQTLTPAESLKVQDTVIASTGGLIVVEPDEPLKVQDSVSASLTVLRMQVTDEGLTPSDAVTGSLTPLLVTVTIEPLKVSDTVTALLVTDPSVTVSAEALKAQDTLTAQLDTLLVTLSESCRVLDTVTVQVSAGVTVGETVKLADGPPVGLLNPVQSTQSDTLHVVDTLTVTIFDVTALHANLTETLHLRDVLVGPPVRDYFIVPAVDRWFVVPATGREFTS